MSDKTIPDHPIQPLYDEQGTIRFKCNAIVRYLLDNGGIDMNKLAGINFPQNDREQFAQLIGYSLSGFSELSYVRDTTYATAALMRETGKSEQDSKLDLLEAKLEAVRKCLRELVPQIFQIHPDDLKE